MKDHESPIVKDLHQKHDKFFEKNCRLEDEVFQKASLPDKIHAYLTMLVIGVIIFGPIYTIVQLVPLPDKIHTYASMVGFAIVIGFPIYVLV